MSTSLPPENEAPGVITDHGFYPSDHNHFLCGATVKRKFINADDEVEFGAVECRLAEAAHTTVVIGYKPSEGTPYRCPDCVTKNVDPCVHGPGNE